MCEARRRIAAIHRASLQVLEETGIEVLSQSARTLFAQAGAAVDESCYRVRLAPELVEQLITTGPLRGGCPVRLRLLRTFEPPPMEKSIAGCLDAYVRARKEQLA